MALPANPTNYSAVWEPGGGGVRLRWTIAANTTQTRIQRWDSNSKLYNDLTTVNAPTNQYFDTSVQDGVSYAYRFNAVNSEGSARFYTSGTNTVTIINIPDPATDVTAAVRGDDSVDVSWTDHATVLAPIRYNYIRRRDNVTGGNGAQINRIDGGLSTYRDSRTSVDRAYRYRTHAANDAGGAYYMSPWSNTVYTTPLAPTGFTARWENNNMRLSWTLGSTIANAVEVEHSNNGTEWYPLPPVGRVGATIHANPERGASHHYRIRALAPVPESGDRKASAWVTAAVVPAYRAPMAPIIVDPTYATPGDVTLTVQHRPVDGTPMSEARAEYRAAGASTWTPGVGLTLPLSGFSAGQRVEVRAYTRGGSASWSPPSAVHTITMRAAPSLPTITSPANGSTVTSQDVTVTWTTPGTQQRAVVMMERGGTVVDHREVTTAQSVVVRTEQGTGQRVGVRWFDGFMWSPVRWHTIAVSLAGPPVPSLNAVVDHDNARVALTATSGTGTPATARLEVYRVVGDQEEKVADATGVDLVPPLMTAFHYVARAYTSQGGWTDSEPVEVFVAADLVIINYGDDLSGRLWAMCDLSFTMSAAVATELHDFGRGFPVEFTGGSMSQVQKVSATLVDELGSTPAEWLGLPRASRDGRPVRKHFRDPLGNSWSASISEVSLSNDNEASTDLSFTATRLDAP